MKSVCRYGLVLSLAWGLASGPAAAQQEPSPVDDAPRGPRDVLTGPGSNPRATVAGATQAPSIGMRQLAGEAVPLTMAAPHDTIAAGSIEVRVRDFRNQPAVGALVRLGVMTQEQARSSREAHTDANGLVVFHGLPTGEGQAYRVNLVGDGATTSTTPFRLPAAAGYRVDVMQLPVTEDSRFLFVWQYDTSVDFTHGKLHLVQQVQLVNGGDAIVRLPEAGLRFALPDGFQNFQSQPMMTDQRIVPDDDGFLLQGSLPPGGQTLLYGFDVPITPGTMTLAAGVPLRVRTVQVISEEAAGVSLSVSGLPAPQVHESPRRMLVTGVQRGATEGPLGTLEITLDGIPGPGPARLIAVGIALALLLFAGFMLLRPKDPHALLDSARLTARDELLKQLERLESQHAAGDVGPEFYARQRAALRDELAAWIKVSSDTRTAAAHSSPR